MPRLPAGQLLGERFKILGVLGEGGMATVYLVEDKLRRERVALKVLHRHLAASPSMRARLRREVIAASRLRHPNALVAHELHELDGQLALSMPVCTGATLSEHVAARGSLSADALRRLGQELSSALGQAHGAGIVHRDLTPNNVMIAPEGHALLMDFGLARLDDGRTATGTGVLGTAGYAAPEVFDGVRADPRSDLYALGAVLYFSATGQSPFAAPSPMATLKRQLANDRAPLGEARPDLPPDLVALVEALLQVEPERRPAGPSAVHDALTYRSLAEEAPLPEGPPAPVDPESLSPTLPAGDWAVELWEQEPLDLLQRARIRSGRDPHGPGLEGILRRIATEIADGVRSALDMPGEVAPELALQRHVATLAELPPEALRPCAALYEKRFLLAVGVDEETARALYLHAKERGFGVALHRREEQSSSKEVQLRGLLAALVGLLAASAIIGNWTMALIAAGVAAYVWVTQLEGTSPKATPFPPLPVAFTEDLKGALTPEYREALEALEARHAEAWSAPTEAAPAAPAQAPAAEADPAPVAGRRAMAQLDALEASLSRRKAEVAPVVIEDLTRTLHQLRARCAALSGHALALQGELDALSTTQGVAADAARVEARLERLSALEAMGQPADAQERERLRAALSEHQATMAEQERLESDLTRALAELLEIGAHASRARRTLLIGGDVASSATDLLAELRGKVDAARAASQETEDASARRRRARAAKATKQRRP